MDNYALTLFIALALRHFTLGRFTLSGLKQYMRQCIVDHIITITNNSLHMYIQYILSQTLSVSSLKCLRYAFCWGLIPEGTVCHSREAVGSQPRSEWMGDLACM